MAKAKGKRTRRVEVVLCERIGRALRTGGHVTYTLPNTLHVQVKRADVARGRLRLWNGYQWHTLTLADLSRVHVLYGSA
jgi:hypothetical protein